MQTVSLNCYCLRASLSSLCSPLGPFSAICLSRYEERHKHAWRTRGKSALYKAGNSTINQFCDCDELLSFLNCFLLKCIRIKMRKHKHFFLCWLGTLIWYSKAPLCSSYNEVLSLLCLPVIPRSPRLSCLRLASEYQQPISICHSCQAHNATEEPRK